MSIEQARCSVNQVSKVIASSHSACCWNLISLAFSISLELHWLWVLVWNCWGNNCDLTQRAGQNNYTLASWRSHHCYGQT
jgi:hypothetical protein